MILIGYNDKLNDKLNDNTFDIEISLCDSIIVCSMEIFLIVLEHCNNDEMCSQILYLMEKILIMNGESGNGE